MAGKAIDNLSIIVSANTRGLAKDLAYAAQQFEQFNKKMERDRQRAGQQSRSRDPATAPFLSEWMRGGKGQGRFGVQPGPGGPFNDFNRRKADAQAKAAEAKARADVADTVRHAASRRAIDAAMKRRDVPEWQKMATEKLSAYGKPKAPGLLRRLWGDDSTGLPPMAQRPGDNPAAKAARETERSFSSFAMTGLKVATGLVAVELGLMGVAGGFQKVKDSIAMAGELEQTTLAFEVMTKSAERARSMVADIRKFAASTPFQMGELQGAARQMLAYGIAADQVMPTMRMLGDVSAAFGKDFPIRDLTYLYGTLHAQQRAYAIDIRQFANRGVPIYEELAKVVGKSNAELKQMVEDGRISSREVTQAFINMTSAGGLFYQMTERQGKTFLGQWEQMVDAFRIAQITFGGVLIEELGLGEATRDLQAFAQRIEQGMDVIRPAIRFVGDLTKAGVQLGYEFTRAGFAIASVNLDVFDRTFPGIRDTVNSFRQLVNDAKDFKFDDEKLIEFGAGVAETFIRTIGSIADATGKAIDAAEGKFGPLLRTFERLDGMFSAGQQGAAQVAGVAAAGIWLRSNPVPPPGRLSDDLLNPAVVERIGIPPVVPGMRTERVRAEYAALTANVNRAEVAVANRRQTLAEQPNSAAARQSLEFGEAWLQQAHHHRGMWVHRSFPGDPGELTRKLNAGEVPSLHAGSLVGSSDAPPGASISERLLASARQVADELKGGARLRREEVERQRVATEARKAADGLVEFRNALLLTGQPLHDVGVALNRDQAARVRHGLGGLGLMLGVGSPWHSAAVAGVWDRQPRPADRVQLPEVFPHLEEMVREFRREYDPRPELTQYRQELDMIRQRRMLGDNTDAITDRAWTKKVGEVAGRFGVGQRQELPPLIEAGSAEDARLINAWRTQPQQTVEQLLQQLNAHVVQILQVAHANVPGMVQKTVEALEFPW